MASYLDKMSAKAWSCWCLSSNIVIERRSRSVIAGRPTISGMDRMCCWISRARRSMPMTWVTRARVMPSRRAMSAWLAASSPSRRAFHSMAYPGS